MSKPERRCFCGHHRSGHNEARRGLPAYCSSCKGAKALHTFEEAAA